MITVYDNLNTAISCEHLSNDQALRHSHRSTRCIEGTFAV